ncbi:hypothetical protein RJ640_016496 [Escallonia rubra]|uniref:Fe2OG dioxygenase domain-containing protein n=1 Tax=Escallonia rubra TaxID=112253 RepID=A0AA88RX56_9ASTE|nr:hypothetical protein RJ640_016496 [Escallonia rubra]
MGEVDAAFIQDLEHRPKLAVIEAEGIPLIDLSVLNSAAENGAIKGLVSEIGDACEKWGFFQVINHGVPPACREKMEVASRKFFEQSKEEKRKVGRDEVNPMGYYDTEHTKNVRDWKEVFDAVVENPSVISASDEPDDEEVRLLLNQWPEYPPNFREACEEYEQETQKLAFKLLELICLSLGLPANRLNGYFKDQTSFMRLNYYPKCPIPHLALGVGRHKDGGALTVLAQDDVGGLEVKRKSDGEWILVKPTPNAYIVNVGDIIQVWSNDKYESVEHRAMVNSERERYSIPFFFKPAHYTMLEPLEELTDNQNPAKYLAYNWGKFMARRNLSNFKKLDVENIQIYHFKVKRAPSGVFFQVINHGVPLQRLKNVQSAAKKFFDQPKEEKLKVRRDELNPFGYSESDHTTTVRDWKEVFDITVEDPILLAASHEADNMEVWEWVNPLLSNKKLDDVGGLEVKRKTDGEWVRVKPTPDAYIINVGDMIQDFQLRNFKKLSVEKIQISHFKESKCNSKWRIWTLCNPKTGRDSYQNERHDGHASALPNYLSPVMVLLMAIIGKKNHGNSSMGEVDPAFIQAPEHRPNLAFIEDENFPLIDLSPINSPECFSSTKAKEHLVSEIGEACAKWGFFQVINHGLPLQRLENAQLAAKKFFDQPKEEKLKVRRDELNPFGYYESEHTKNVRDWKEVIDIAVEEPTLMFASHEADNTELTEWVNRWPKHPPEFRKSSEEYANELQKLAYKLLELISLSLGLPANRLNGFFKDHTTRIRFNHYPPCPIPGLALGVGRHKDGAALTILAQDEVGGLEVRRKTDGEWIRVKPTPGAYIINVGDIIQVWSNDKYESVEHRVMVNSERDRFSIPFFFGPAHYTMVQQQVEDMDLRNFKAGMHNYQNERLDGYAIQCAYCPHSSTKLPSTCPEKKNHSISPMEEVDPTFIQAPEHRPKFAVTEDEGIPLIDISPIYSPECFSNTKAKEHLVSEIGEACSKWGFFQVINHGVPLHRLENVQSAAKKFFYQPKEEKLKVRRDELNSLGYYDTEHTKNVRDWKEVIDITVEDPTLMAASHEADNTEVTEWVNRWPKYPPEFREAFEEYANEMQKLVYKLLELISLSLGLPASRLNGFFKDQTSHIRFNHYPPCPIPGLALGVGRHKDAVALTILAQDDVGGLEVRRKTDGKWIRVKPTPDAYIINVGDMIQVWSNDKYESVEHRVMVNPERERFSIPFFLSPAHYTMVKPLEELLDEQNPAKYRTYNWGKFLATRKRSNFKKLNVENIQIYQFKDSK